MWCSSARSRVLSNMASPLGSHHTHTAIQHEVERRAEVLDLRLRDQPRVHRANQIGAREVEQAIAVRIEEPSLEAVEREVRDAAMALELVPDRRDEDLLRTKSSVGADRGYCVADHAE